MKIFRKNQAQRFQNGAHCVAFEYPTEDKDINGAAIEISGRYPEKGRAVNRKCKELAFVIKGNGKVVIDGNEQLIEEGDLISIEAGEKFFWDGEMRLFMPCAPAWYPEQYEMVE